MLGVLAQHCVKASFFLVGRYARARPDLVRAEAALGHVIGVHTFSHPDNLHRLSLGAAESEIYRGFQAVQDALTGASPAAQAQLAPFFRFPGLNDSAPLVAWLGRRQIAVVGADFGADDWKGIGAAAIERKGLIAAAESNGGVLILHDTRPHTADALSDLITRLEQRGYRFVQLAPTPGALERAAHAPGAVVAPPSFTGAGQPAESRPR